MAKPEVMRRKQEMLAEREAERNRQLAASAAATMAAEIEKAPRIALTAEGAFFNRAWLARWAPGWSRQPNRDATLPATSIPGLPGDYFSFHDLEDALDMGRFGTGVMGRLEIFIIRSFDDVRGWDRAHLGIPMWPDKAIVSQAKTRNRGLADLFERYRGDGPTAIRPVEVLSGSTSMFSVTWCRAGAPRVLADVCPIEVGFDHQHSSIIYVRRIQDAPAQAPAPQSVAEKTEAGGAAHLAASAAPASAPAEPGGPAASSAAPATPAELARARRHERAARRAANAANSAGPGDDLEGQ